MMLNDKVMNSISGKIFVYSLGLVFILFTLKGFGQTTPLPNAVDTLDLPRSDTGKMEVSSDTNLLKLNGDYLLSIPQGWWYTVGRPFHWNKKSQWQAGAAVLLVGGSLLVEKELQQLMLRNQNNFSNSVATVVEPFGNNYFPVLLLGMYGVGRISGHRKLEHSALMGARSLLVSTAIYTPIKGLVRRNRPANTTDHLDFRAPFTPDFTSFPSGHTNTAFTVATSLALEYKHTKWVPVLAYSVATLTGISRVYQNRHWLSDVLVGAFIGHFTAKSQYYFEQRRTKKVIPKTPPAL